MAGSALWLIGAMLLQGAIALCILAYLGTIRLPMIARGEVRMPDIALSRSGWPERERKVSNAFDNQFQLPLLFYVACFVAIQLGAGLIEVLLAFAFVGSRIVHALIHVTSNDVVRRFTAFALGFGLLVLFWLALLVRLVIVAAA